MKKVIWVLIVIALTGCSGTKMMQHTYLKNYKLGEIQTAYIGEPIIRIRDIYQEVSNNNNKCFYATPSNDFIISGIYQFRSGIFQSKFMSGIFQSKSFETNLNIKVSSQKNYSLNDRIDLDGVIYYIFDIVDIKNKTYGLLVDSKGKIYVNAFYDRNHDRGSRYDLHNAVLSPDNITMIISDKIAPCYGADDDIIVGNNNFELLYGGINNVSISIMYREFTRDNLARPSFFQNIVYETSAKEIRFKNFKVAVVDSTNEKILYKIIEDKLEDVFFPSDGKDISSLEKAEMNNMK